MENNHDYNEWVIARNSIDRFDSYRIDLRKYGFTFITGILTAQAILLQPLSYGIKFSVIIVTIALILAVALFEQNIILMQHAAVQRALILERRLNLELTELISYQYKLNNGGLFKYLLYLIFIIGTCIFAFFLIGTDLHQLFENPLEIFQNFDFKCVLGLLIFAVIALFGIFHFYKYKPRPDYEDWTVDKVVCQTGDNVGITLTNLNEKEPIKAGFMGKIKKEDFKEPYKIEDKCELNLHSNIAPENNFTWFLNTDGWDEGIYLICPNNRLDPLQRKVKVVKKQ